MLRGAVRFASSISVRVGAWLIGGTAARPSVGTRRVSLQFRAHMNDNSSGGGLRNTLYRKLTRSGRRMTAGRRLAYRIAVPLALGIMAFFWRTCRVVSVVGMEHLDAALARAPSLLP